jgi:hypothetical protein
LGLTAKEISQLRTEEGMEEHFERTALVKGMKV